MPVPSIPDHDGRVAPGLDAALAEIDRLYRLDYDWRTLRAAACYNFGDAMGWHRETVAALDEFADRRGLTRRQVSRLVLPASEWLAKRNRPGRN